MVKSALCGLVIVLVAIGLLIPSCDAGGSSGNARDNTSIEKTDNAATEAKDKEDEGVTAKSPPRTAAKTRPHQCLPGPHRQAPSSPQAAGPAATAAQALTAARAPVASRVLLRPNAGSPTTSRSGSRIRQLGPSRYPYTAISRSQCATFAAQKSLAMRLPMRSNTRLLARAAVTITTTVRSSPATRPSTTRPLVTGKPWRTAATGNNREPP